MELELQVIGVLERAGLKRGQIVLDFGCGSRTYTVGAAKIVAEQGKVYALDKDRKALDKLMQKAWLAQVKNMERIDTLES